MSAVKLGKWSQHNRCALNLSRDMNMRRYLVMNLFHELDSGFNFAWMNHVV